jgi:uncharacterized protein (DUF58 family)
VATTAPVSRATARSVAVAVREGLTRLLRRSLDSSHLYRAVRRIWSERLTTRGRFLFVACLLIGLAGLDTRRSLAYQLFAAASGPFLVAWVVALRRPPRVRLEGEIPLRLTAGRRVSMAAVVTSASAGPSGPLVVSWPGATSGSSGLHVVPEEAFVDVAPGRPARVGLDVTPSRRGRFVVPGLGVAGTDPLGLLATRCAVRQPLQSVLAYPRFFQLDALPLPVGRRYQPGGIPLASSLGDSSEFVGTRDYRDGDPVRRIHWRSWARRGGPVVKEYQEEYFSRIALVLDTFLPRRPRAAERNRFEAAVSVLASVAGYFSRTEDVVDIFAAGPDVYEVSTGRSLAYLENVLEVLACLEPCHDTPFARLEPHLDERLSRLTSVVAVVLDWDEARETFLWRLRDQGVAVRVFLVHEGSTRKPWADAAERVGEIEHVTPAEVARRVDEEEG